jgi:hypothetical protein
VYPGFVGHVHAKPVWVQTVMTVPGIQRHASGIVTKVTTIVLTGIPRRFAVLGVVLAEMPLSRTGLATSSTFAIPHRLSAQDIARHVPATTYRAAQWGKRKCPFDDCSYKSIRQKMESHLRGRSHGLSNEEAIRRMEEAMEG